MTDTSGTHLCTVDKCHETASALYAWDWGEQGACCQKHQYLLNQRGQQLGRTCTFTPLQAVTPALGRDERQQMYAKQLALEDELAASKNQAAELYNDNNRLRLAHAQQLSRANDLQSQLDDHKARLKEIALERDEMTRQRDDARAEAESMKLLVPPPDKRPAINPPQSTAAGLPPAHSPQSK